MPSAFPAGEMSDEEGHAGGEGRLGAVQGGVTSSQNLESLPRFDLDSLLDTSGGGDKKEGGGAVEGQGERMAREARVRERLVALMEYNDEEIVGACLHLCM